MKDLLPMLVGWAIFAVVVLIGCVITVSITSCESMETPHTDTQKASHYIHYYKDARTGLCFAGSAGDYEGATLTNVSCTPEVEKLVGPLPNYIGQ